ncbi:hypothetical protein [Flavobacterium terrae]|uniref:Uncharacterized membrane protein n=1 Tax=Flavobacterium terrae TaxID=415425 RepID=A0A1M6EKU6_9FLAO|nr:hypothetical protein [Flavobacterium terrae]SHI86121.1 Uncharacterized membrane protein [Flavobacterium terrae]
MNDAHLHMVVNHFPIIGLFFGIAILAFGILKKNPQIINIAYVIFVFCMIMGKVSMFTGDKAEDVVENLGISRNVIHNHEELAEGFMKVMYLLGLVSFFGLFANTKKHNKALLLSYLIFIISIVGAVLAKPVGTSGGEIRHTEIRENNGNGIPNNISKEENED